MLKMRAAVDPSTRFILPIDSPLVANLAALWASDPALAEKVERTQSGGGCVVAPSKAGPPTLAWNDNDRQFQLHSRYNPMEEAGRLADSVDTTDKLVLFIHGFGLGYHVERLLEKSGRETQLFVFEPRIEILRAAVEARDLAAVFSSRRVTIFTDPDKAAFFAALMPHAAAMQVGYATLRHPPSMQVARSEHSAFEALTQEFTAYAKTSVSTLVINGRRTAENIIRNLPWYVAAPSLSRLSGAFVGEPAIIVSAGPSLRKNKHLLTEAAGNAVIIAVQTTLQPLLELGIEPHFVTSLDYHDISSRFFERLPSNLRTELVAEPKATEAVFGLHPGPISLLGNEFADALLSEMRLEKARLNAGATVAHLAFYLAEHLGCDPIIFVGQDLGFSDGLCYTPGTSYEDVWRPELGRFCTVEMKQWEQIVRDRAILRRVSDHAGRPMYTEERLFTYLQHFERDFARTKARVIDATEGGVLKRGAAPMTLREAIDRFCRKPLSRSVPAHGGFDWSELQTAVYCLNKRRDEARQIARISADTLPLLEEIRDHLDDQSRVNRAIARIDKLRLELNGFGKCYELVTQLTQQTEMQRFVADRLMAAADITASDRQKRQVTRDIENVRAIRSAAELFIALIEQAADRLRQFALRELRRAA